MRLYLMNTGLALLQSVSRRSIGPLTLTGSVVSGSYNFVPTKNEASIIGPTLLDNSTVPGSVKQTLVSEHETIFSVRLGQDLEFADTTPFGNIMIYTNSQPFIWLVSEIPLNKLKTDTLTRFAGDEYYISGLLRYPYLRSLITYVPSSGLHAKMQVFSTMEDLTIPEHTLSDQVQIDQNTLPNGGNKMIIGSRITDEGYYASPISMLMDKDFGKIIGGSTKGG